MADRPPPPPIIVTGAGGRIGRLLRRLWPGAAAIWLTRQEWDILAGPAPDLPTGAVWLDLAGITRGDVTLNPVLAKRVALAAARAEGRLLHVSSASVYPGGAGLMGETMRPAPPSDYGRSKAAAERETAYAPGAVILRLGNLAGADAILGVDRGGAEAVIDPVGIGAGGPVRSYIGPHVLAGALLGLCRRDDLPPVLNLAQPGPVAMGDLLTAAGRPWRFGPERAGVIARVVLDTTLLQGLTPLPQTDAAGLVDDLRRLGGWPA